jgi:hypothetical protein
MELLQHGVWGNMVFPQALLGSDSSHSGVETLLVHNRW